MTIWLDSQLPPQICGWITANLGMEAVAVRDLDLMEARDMDIFRMARAAECIVMSKDLDFVNLSLEYGPPPYVIWLRCGNTSNAKLRQILRDTLADTVKLIDGGAPVVEIGDIPKTETR